MSGVSTPRVQAHRERARCGKVSIRAELPEDDLLHVLTVGGLLHPSQADDPKAVSEALAEQICILRWLANSRPDVLRILSLMAACEDD